MLVSQDLRGAYGLIRRRCTHIGVQTAPHLLEAGIRDRRELSHHEGRLAALDRFSAGSRPAMKHYVAAGGRNHNSQQVLFHWTEVVCKAG